LVEKMRAIAKSHRATPAQVALAWLLSKNVVSSILIGATKMSQLEDNLQAVSVQLTENELKDLDAMTELPPVYPGWFHKSTQDKVVQESMTPARQPVMAG